MVLEALRCDGIDAALYGEARVEPTDTSLKAAIRVAQEGRFRTSVDTVSIYATVSDSDGRLVPDLATMRDRAKTKIRKFCYGLFALGWGHELRAEIERESARLKLVKDQIRALEAARRQEIEDGKQPLVAELIRERFPATAQLTVAALLVALLLALPMGLLSAAAPGTARRAPRSGRPCARC